jgi:DNA polymerase-4
MGIKTIGALASASHDLLIHRFGKMGDMLYKNSRGHDDSPVEPIRDDAKSVGNGFTFRHDLLTEEEYRVGIDFLSEEIGYRLKKQEMLCSTVSITVKDEFLKTIQRQRPIDPPTDISKEISKLAFEILLDEWKVGKPIRMITVTASNLIHKSTRNEQISFFSEPNDKQREKYEKMENAVDKIRQKYGGTAIVNGAILDSDIGVFAKGKQKSK